MLGDESSRSYKLDATELCLMGYSGKNDNIIMMDTNSKCLILDKATCSNTELGECFYKM